MTTLPSPATAKKPRRWLRRLLIYLAVPYLTAAVLLVVFQRSMMYFPKREAPLPPALAGRPPQEAHAIETTAVDGVVLHGWCLLAVGRGARDEAALAAELAIDRPVVLYFPGNAGNRSWRQEETGVLTTAGAHVFLFDYRGYGDNEGSPSESALAADAHAVWRYTTHERGIEPRRIVLYGESLGGGVATRLAAELCEAGTPPGGLVLRSTFSSAVDVGCHQMPWLPVRWCMFDKYPSIERIPGVTCPVMILHGECDSLIPCEFGERLFAAAPEKSSAGVPRRMVRLASADHNDVLETERDAYRTAVADFLHDLFPPPPAEEKKTGSMIEQLIRSMTYFPDRARDLSPATIGLPRGRFHAIETTTADGIVLHGWHALAGNRIADDRAACDRELAAGRPVALFFSGNGGNRSYRVEELEVLTAAGADVFLFDYRGYGDNAGEPGEQGLAEDARAIWRYATRERNVDRSRLVLFGESLGGAVAIRLAAELCAEKTPPAGLIVRSTFSSLGDIAAHHYPLLPARTLLKGQYASLERLAAVHCPILILHGRKDTIVPFQQGQRLFAAANAVAGAGIAPRFVELPAADHNDIVETEGEKYRTAVTEFLGKVQP